MPLRAPDGRFVPRTGEAVLPPRQQQPRDEHGHFIPKDKVQSSKPYSKAVRELLDAPAGENPSHWPDKRTEAQELAMVHCAMARAGNVQVGMMIVDRAEGKVPQAAEDRDAVMKAGAGVRLLADLLGVNIVDVTDAEIVPQGSLEAKPEEPCETNSDLSSTDALTQDSESLSDLLSTSLPSSSSGDYDK